MLVRKFIAAKAFSVCLMATPAYALVAAPPHSPAPGSPAPAMGPQNA